MPACIVCDVPMGIDKAVVRRGSGSGDITVAALAEAVLVLGWEAVYTYEVGDGSGGDLTVVVMMTMWQ